jgi:hypothetical protein
MTRRVSKNAQLQQQIQSLLENERKKTKKIINDQEHQVPPPRGETGQEIVNAIREGNKKLENAIKESNRKIGEELSAIQRANRIQSALLRMEARLSAEYPTLSVQVESALFD